MSRSILTLPSGEVTHSRRRYEAAWDAQCAALLAALTATEPEDGADHEAQKGILTIYGRDPGITVRVGPVARIDFPNWVVRQILRLHRDAARIRTQKQKRGRRK